MTAEYMKSEGKKIDYANQKREWGEGQKVRKREREKPIVRREFKGGGGELYREMAESVTKKSDEIEPFYHVSAP